jgi:hypothetical protein
MYDNKHHMHDTMMTNHTGFNLKHIFGVVLHHKVISITLKLIHPQSNCLLLAVSVPNLLRCSNPYLGMQDNGLVWFLNHQITKELVYHVVFWHKHIPGCCDKQTWLGSL